MGSTYISPLLHQLYKILNSKTISSKQTKKGNFKCDPQTLSLAVQFTGKSVKLELVACDPHTATGLTQKLAESITVVVEVKLTF